MKRKIEVDPCHVADEAAQPDDVFILLQFQLPECDRFTVDRQASRNADNRILVNPQCFELQIHVGNGFGDRSA